MMPSWQLDGHTGMSENRRDVLADGFGGLQQEMLHARRTRG